MLQAAVPVIMLVSLWTIQIILAFPMIFCKPMGRYPRLPLAAAGRNIENTRRIIAHVLGQNKHIHRFSILSLDILKKIFAAFTPEELIYVELLPQFPEAPACHFAKTGRAREYSYQDKVTEEEAGTISCISGFVVNMAEQSLRLVTPCLSTAKEPTGERILAKAYLLLIWRIFRKICYNAQNIYVRRIG